MSVLLNFYHKKLADNEKHLKFWTDYLRNLEKLDFEQFGIKLKVPILVPIGSRILFRGELKHTNEVTVALGADYFAKCSTKQAEVLRQHRIKDAKTKVEALMVEKEFLENQMTFNSENVFDSSGKEIVEFHTQEEDKIWREDHRKKVRLYKQNEAKIENNNDEEITDEALWSRLEELELQEELENELMLSKNRQSSDRELDIKPTFIVKEEETMNASVIIKHDNKQNNEGNSTTKVKSKMDILQQVIDKQNELEIKISELRNQERSETNTEADLIKRLDEMETLDELEDEMNRLEDILEDDVEEIENVEEKSSKTKIKRNVSFADEDDSETIEITFKHSSEQPVIEPYDANAGVTKPSHIYQAFPYSFTETTSILKKTKQIDTANERDLCKINLKDKLVQENNEAITKTIVIKDVIEKNDIITNELEIKDVKPISLFKQRRLRKSE